MRLTSSASDMERLRYMCLMNIAGCDWGRSGSRRGRRFWPPALPGAVLGGQGCNGFPTSGRRRPSLTYGANISVRMVLPSPYRRFWRSTGSFSLITSLLDQFRLNYFVLGADLFILLW